MGCDTRFFNLKGLQQLDDAAVLQTKVVELRKLVGWAEGMVWTSPERQGAVTGLMKSQIDWIP